MRGRSGYGRLEERRRLAEVDLRRALRQWALREQPKSGERPLTEFEFSITRSRLGPSLMGRIFGTGARCPCDVLPRPQSRAPSNSLPCTEFSTSVTVER